MPRTVPELPVREDRYGNEWCFVLVERSQEESPAQFGDVELLALQHALEDAGDDVGVFEVGVRAFDGARAAVASADDPDRRTLSRLQLCRLARERQFAR